MKLQKIVHSSLRQLCPQEEVLIYHSLGQENIKGKIKNIYAAPLRLNIAVQSQAEYLKHENKLSETEVKYKAYLPVRLLQNKQKVNGKNQLTTKISPAGTLPDMRPADALPAETLPAMRPADALPADALPADTLPAMRPADTLPAGTSPDMRPADALPAGTLPDMRPADALPAMRPADALPAGTLPADTLPAMRPADALPAGTSPDMCPAGIVRRCARSGDFIQRADKSFYLIVEVLEEFSSQGWLAVSMVEQSIEPDFRHSDWWAE